MKVGLVTIYTVPNFGSVLQAFATQKLLEKSGHECKIINYAYPNEWHYHHGFNKPSTFRSLLRNLRLKAQHRKKKILDNFCATHFNLTPLYKNLDSLRKEKWDDYDAFIAGSDQIWNARYLKGDSFFMLSFVPDGISCFSLASSFALKEIPEVYVTKYKKELSKFKAFSVREKNGIDIIQKQLGINKDVFVCLDPTLLLSKEEWLRIVPRSKFKKKRSYILFYMWTYAFEPRPYIFEVLKYFQQQMDCEVIALEGFTKKKYALGVQMSEASDSSIPEFIDLFSNADLVITSSFHGTAFALNFGIPLISIVPNNDGDDRQSCLLNSVEANNCIVKIGEDIKSICPNYDITKIISNLSEKREKCIKWINNCMINKKSTL